MGAEAEGDDFGDLAVPARVAGAVTSVSHSIALGAFVNAGSFLRHTTWPSLRASPVTREPE